MQTKKCSKCGETKFVTEFHKKKGGKYGVRSHCKECRAAYREVNKEAIAAYNAARYAANKEAIAAYNAAYRAANKEAIAAYRAANKKKLAAYRYAYNKANPDKLNAINAKRRARKLQASPTWADRKKVQKFYKYAKLLELRTGQTYHVDHIVPLQHSLVCGLHNEFNLQVLTATENMRKHNKFTVFQ